MSRRVCEHAKATCLVARKRGPLSASSCSRSTLAAGRGNWCGRSAGEQPGFTTLAPEPPRAPHETHRHLERGEPVFAPLPARTL